MDSRPSFHALQGFFDLLHLCHLSKVQAHTALVPRLDLRLVQQVQRLPKDPYAMAHQAFAWGCPHVFQGAPMVFGRCPFISALSPAQI